MYFHFQTIASDTPVKIFLLALSLILSVLPLNGFGQKVHKIAIEWRDGQPSGFIQILSGKLGKIEIRGGRGNISGNQFTFRSAGTARLEITVENANLRPGSEASIVAVHTEKNPFSFFLRDVSADFPIYLPEFQVVVTDFNDPRSFSQIESALRTLGSQTKLQQIENESEESFENAAAHCRHRPCPTWLGLSRDIRIFELATGSGNLTGEMDVIRPLLAASPVQMPEPKKHSAQFGFVTGRGQGVTLNVRRRLEEGVLPLLHTTLVDDDIQYHSVAFVSLEQSPLVEKNVRGTPFLVADHFSHGHMFTEAQKSILQPQLENEKPTEETVLFFRTTAVNQASVPRYAWFKTLKPGTNWGSRYAYVFEKATGFSKFTPEAVFCISKVNGTPLPDEEISILLKPGESAIFEFILPHQPISENRARQLAARNFEEKHRECRNFWREKLNQAARIRLPEKRIEEMLQAGLLHLDLVTYGREPQGALAPMIGVYSPIGTESSPIIQFNNSMGRHDIARRALMYFLEKQHEDGLIQNFNGYMVETGAALWSMGEYFRYTRDATWVRQVAPQLLKSCEYLLNWRKRNQVDSLRGKGYGLIEGKVADPEDTFHQFMLNGYAYLGLSRVAEMLEAIDPANSARLRREADAWKQDIRTALFQSMASAPVVPLGDGTWCPTVPPWTEAIGLQAQFVQPGNAYTHGTFTARDALIGPLYLIFCEVLDPAEPAARTMLNYHCELFYQRNAAFSQPYYSRHAWVELKLGLIKPFLKTYYNTVSALADRETYTFWEHLYLVSVHKTHEEAWFLMQTRWMLYLEDAQTLRLLPGIPRAWLENGKSIDLEEVASYFGPVSLHVNSNLEHGFMEATIACPAERKPETVVLRLPHPVGQRPRKVSGGVYDAQSETIKIQPFTGAAAIKLEF
jgi:hypothetical protein